MRDWNVVVTARERGFVMACELLEPFGRVSRTGFYNVLVMKVADPARLMDGLAELASRNPGMFNFAISRVVPARHAFDFRTPEEFETTARETAAAWAPELAGKRFHVRMHRRGFKGRLSTPDEERFLDHVVLEALEAQGAPGAIDFDDPDAIIGVETVGERAGMSLWTREDLKRYPFLRFD